MSVLVRYLRKEHLVVSMKRKRALRTFDSICRSCSSSVTLNSSILLTVKKGKVCIRAKRPIRPELIPVSVA